MEIIERTTYLNHVLSLLDKGVMIILTGQRRVGKSCLLEQNRWDVAVGTLRAGEIDFVARKGEDIIYVQVAYLLSSDDTISREFGSLARIPDNHPKYVVSLDPIEGGFSEYPGIKHVHLRHFLMSEE